ncbi:unnamed protein product [Blepharisma stoltei]|uniref:Uncharacterized protein n=1 Tax=Blepharisma stoltei TaxID=1481888 RepID=A0AAU9ISW0_9CILI|nr:unnamed protein product [Blepharisma stoltei]
MASSAILVVGASKGIGKALVILLAKTYPSHQVFAFSRAISSQQSEFSSISSNIQCIDADSSTTEGVNTILQAVTQRVKFLVYGAADVGPKWDENITPEDFDRNMNVNARGAFFITRGLQHQFEENAKILFITTGCGRFYAIPTPLYSISKAAFNMIAEIMKKEIHGASVGLVEPGLARTNMYRMASEKAPGLGSLATISPEIVGKFLSFLLSDRVNGEEFSSHIWDIYDTQHHSRWHEAGDEELISPF